MPPALPSPSPRRLCCLVVPLLLLAPAPAALAQRPIPVPVSLFSPDPAGAAAAGLADDAYLLRLEADDLARARDLLLGGSPVSMPIPVAPRAVLEVVLDALAPTGFGYSLVGYPADGVPLPGEPPAEVVRLTVHGTDVAGEIVSRLGGWTRPARSGRAAWSSVQDALHGSLARLSTLRSAHAAALRSYLRRAVENRIGDYQRRALFRLNRVGEPSEPPRFSDDGAPQPRQLIDMQTWARYLKGLERLTPRQRRLVVGRVESGYSYGQLALVERLPSPAAARMAFRRALKRLSDVMPEG